MDNILEFFDSILISLRVEKEVNIDKRLDYMDREDLDKNYFATRQQFIDLLNEYEIKKK